MKKKLSFLFFILFFVHSFAQLDREHWFAPMVDRTGNSNQFQKIYLSTNRVTPFPVSIYNNNILIGTVTISKGSPQKFDVARNYIITTQQTDLFTPITKGLYLKADFPFYANLRFSVLNHAEIITSKGIPSTGTTFYTAMAPITALNPILNFMTSVLATQDNTTVTVSGYNPTIQFSNGTTGATNPTLTFTLNKGQSYIIEGNGNLSQNSDSFIGSKIVSDKPINVTNGNFNGQYAGNFLTSSDILMDQSVPTNRLGNEFALVKGNGDIGSKMEGAIVVAIQNNTQVFLNNETVPIITLNEGDYYVVPDSKYQLQGTSHYNLYIKTTNNAYVYQLLAGVGSGGATIATGGFNFIPALNCYLPKQIDELGLINENEVFSNGNPSGILNIPTKLNLITETGANVLVNGATPIAANGPFPVTGTTNWVTYGIPNVSGNITVTSDKAITAGITAGSDAVGYGGFFAGFPTDPIIIASGGPCAPGITLTIDPVIYNTYQWYFNGNPIPGANSASYNPTTPGYYSASVTMGSCAPLVATQYKVLKCMVNSTSTYNICSTQSINPTFSSVSTPQNVIPSSVAITTNPTKGTVVINPTTGEIIYTANNPGILATDTFTYTFCGNDVNFPECETVTVTINIQDLTVNNAIVKACNVSGQGTFNLTSATITTLSPVTIKYYPTLIDAQNENAAAQITNPTTYLATAGTIVYALVINSSGCRGIAQIALEFFPLAVVSNFTGTYCDTNVDGNAEVTLSSITPQVLTNASYYTVSYYANLVDANAGNTNTLPNNWTFPANTTIFIHVASPDGCPAVIKPIQLVVGAKIPLLNTSTTQTLCDNDLDGTFPVTLSNYSSQYTIDPNVTVTYHLSLSDAQNNINPITAAVNVTNTQTFYIRFSSPNACPNIAPITINIKKPKASLILNDKVICENSKTSLDAGPGFDHYLWSTGSTASSITNVGIGNYWVELTTNNGCVYKQYVTITAAILPEISAIDIKEGNVTITVTGGTPPYQYSLDNSTWQTSNTFFDLPRGNYTVYVKDAIECSVVQKDFAIINLINAITPNGDGSNDNIDYSELLLKDSPVFKIYDRYGQEIFVGSPKNRFIWDGNTHGGRPVPTATYWYILQWKEFGTKTTLSYTSWLLVKNRNNHYFEH